MGLIDKNQLLTTQVQKISSFSKYKRSRFLNNLKVTEDKTPIKNNVWIIYIATFICVLVLLSVIIGLVIYIWNRRAVINRLNGVECKSSVQTSTNTTTYQYHKPNGNRLVTSANGNINANLNTSPATTTHGSGRRNCWFKFGTFSSMIHRFSGLPSTQDNNETGLPSVMLVQEVQPIVSREQSFYLGTSNTLTYSPQSPSIMIAAGSGVNSGVAGNTLTTTGSSISGQRIISHSYRAKNKGLLESRRGSRTSLTLSLSPSADSISSTRSPSPQRTTDNEHDKSVLLKSSLPLTIDQLRERVLHQQFQHHNKYSPSSDTTIVAEPKSSLSNVAELLFQEFWSLPMNHPSRSELSISGMANKNRYRSILPNEKTRVILPQINDNYLSTYINANYIRGYKNVEKRFVATQGPMPQTIDDFWRMIWHVQATQIVMLTKLKEKNKRKCEYYLPPDSGKQEKYGEIIVSIESAIEMEGYTVRTLNIRHIDSFKWLQSKHYWFTSWPDHGSPSPETTTHLLSLVETVEFSNQQSKSSSQSSLSPSISTNGPPIVVHCSAGLGRTGCFLALCTACRQLFEEGQVDVLGIVSRMRLDRGGLVNNNDQYEFLHRALLQYSHSIPLSHTSSAPSPLSVSPTPSSSPVNLAKS